MELFRVGQVKGNKKAEEELAAEDSLRNLEEKVAAGLIGQ